MRKTLLMAAICLSIAACGGKENTAATPSPEFIPQALAASNASHTAIVTNDAERAALVKQAMQAGQAFSAQLRNELQMAMKSGGPLSAINVCHTRAPEIAQAVSAEKNVQVSRVSLKNRNSNQGQPLAWQKAVLEGFDQRKAAGEAADGLLYAEINGSEFRFMKAIATDKVCLTCHGTDIKPEVSALINKLYPADKATGYQEGELRGALVVIKNLAQ